MSVLIQGMEMPENCFDCPFEQFGDCYGGRPKRIQDIEDYTNARHPNCPLREVKKDD